MRLSIGVGLVVWAFAMSAAAQAPAEDPNGLDAPDEEEDEQEGGVPVVEGEGPGVVIVEDSTNPTPPPGYQDQPLTPVPQQQQQPAPGYGQQQPGYGQQQPGYGYAQQPGYQPRYHREPYVEGMQLPPNAQVVTRVRKGLLIPGIAMFAAGYISMVFTYSLIDGFSGDPPGTMLIPLVGPFFLMPDAESAGRVLLGFDALLQIGGMTMLILGATLKAKYVTWYGDSGVRVTPLASRSGGGLQMSLSF